MIEWYYLDTFHAHILRLFWQSPFLLYSFYRNYSMCCMNHASLCCNLPDSSYFVSKEGYMIGFLIPFPPWMQFSSILQNCILIIRIDSFISYSWILDLHLSSRNTAMLTKVIITLFHANIFRGFDLQLFLDTKFLPKCITRRLVSEWNIWPIIIM